MDASEDHVGKRDLVAMFARVSPVDAPNRVLGQADLGVIFTALRESGYILVGPRVRGQAGLHWRAILRNRGDHRAGQSLHARPLHPAIDHAKPI